MEKTHYYCKGCLEIISEESFNNGKMHCTREGCPFYGKPFTPIMYCTECHAYYPPGRIHYHFIPGIVHHHAPNRIPAVTAHA